MESKLNFKGAEEGNGRETEGRSREELRKLIVLRTGDSDKGRQVS
jgi:hypothetical protein